MGEVLYQIFRAAVDSYLQVTVFVAGALLLFGLIDYKLQGGFIVWIETSRKLQPLIGALLGATPGCGGAIFLMPLYIKKSVSFGTVVATLIATAGDAAFVLISTSLSTYLLVTAICLVVAVVTGYILDAMGAGLKENDIIQLPNPETDHPSDVAIDIAASLRDPNIEGEGVAAGNTGNGNSLGEYCELPSSALHHVGHQEGDAIDIVLHHHTKHPKQDSLGYRLTHHGYWVFWLVALVGLIPGIMLLAGYDLEGPEAMNRFWNGLGFVGAALSVVLFVAGKKFLAASDHEGQEHKLYSIKETFIHSGGEVAFVATWVFVAYLFYELLVLAVGGSEVIASWMTAAGFLSVVLGSAVGLIPGCGPQVIFVSLFAKGMVPFSALLANAISQDGDALFPLMALHRPSALKATIVTTVPALIVGGIAYWVEFFVLG